MKILITGGMGYIGSHTCVELIAIGHEVVILDNLSNSNTEVLNRIEKITGVRPSFYEVDIRSVEEMKQVFDENTFDLVIHFAGLKAVGESVEQPLKYYANNVYGTINLLQIMNEYCVKEIVFSSSATVYGVPDVVPITEKHKLSSVNPYGRSKLMTEDVLRDLYIADKEWKISILRYFNPIGAHESGMIGESPNGIPNNLMPYISQVAIGKREFLNVYGADYETVDGTGVRDYIHVVDLAKAHIAAMNILNKETSGVYTHNIGTGKGYSVLEMINSFEKASGNRVEYKIIDRRSGDVAECYADTTLAKKELDWSAEKSIEDMCVDTWNWQVKNPNGYE